MWVGLLNQSICKKIAYRIFPFLFLLSFPFSNFMHHSITRPQMPFENSSFSKYCDMRVPYWCVHNFLSFGSFGWHLMQGMKRNRPSFGSQDTVDEIPRARLKSFGNKSDLSSLHLIRLSIRNPNAILAKYFL